MRELVRMVRVASLAGVPLDIAVDTHEYHEDRTLVLYRTQRPYLKSLLMPQNEAQALHIVPYPNHVAAGTREAHRQQVYNSWWNGRILGYPEAFVRSYCSSMHVDLTDEEKQREMTRAQRDLRNKRINIAKEKEKDDEEDVSKSGRNIRNISLSLMALVEPIHIGYDQEVTPAVWAYLGV